MKSTDILTLGAGCFWCVEAVFQQIEGVVSVASGYMGGHVENPSYEQVCTKTTGHVEVIQVEFDPEIISIQSLLEWFWGAHDPTQADGQGADIGPQYATAIFVKNDEQRNAAEASKTEAQKNFDKPIATTIRDIAPFYLAENYHQDYYFQNSNRNPYCQMVITPKLQKLGLKH